MEKVYAYQCTQCGHSFYYIERDQSLRCPLCNGTQFNIECKSVNNADEFLSDNYGDLSDLLDFEL